jgi:hypothetical protein
MKQPKKATIKERIYKFFMKDYDERVSYAKSIKSMIKDSTRGSINHFYDMNGEQIRGYDNRIVRSRKVEHPLISKYK